MKLKFKFLRSIIAGVGERFQIACHAGAENQFTYTINRGADAAPLENGSIAERQIGHGVFLPLFDMIDSRLDKADKQRMGLVGAAFEFGMELNAHEEILMRQLDGFHQPPIRRKAGET